MADIDVALRRHEDDHQDAQALGGVQEIAGQRRDFREEITLLWQGDAYWQGEESHEQVEVIGDCQGLQQEQGMSVLSTGTPHHQRQTVRYQTNPTQETHDGAFHPPI